MQAWYTTLAQIHYASFVRNASQWNITNRRSRMSSHLILNQTPLKHNADPMQPCVSALFNAPHHDSDVPRAYGRCCRDTLPHLPHHRPS